MNVALSLMRRDRWSAQKFRFALIYLRSVQNLAPCLIKSSIWCLEEKWN